MKENRGGLLETTRRIEQWPIVRLSTVSRPGGEPGPANNSISTLLEEEENLRWRFILPPSSPFFLHGHVKCISIFSPLPIEFFIEHALSLSLSLSLNISSSRESSTVDRKRLALRRKEERKKKKQRKKKEREKKIKEWKEKISRW